MDSLVLGRTAIDYVKEFKYLGITLDEMLTCSTQVKRVLHRAVGAVLVGRQLFNKNWGLQPVLVLFLYRASVRPMISYGCIVWWTKVDHTTVRL